ncbi:hypothetical protein [Nonomuraea sp. B19D2]|uniref:hypothetical protein n=1 Tax=Nonomuraea sp. B19D2 TaxID=3159561 RepID=UPI0032DA2B8C
MVSPAATAAAASRHRRAARKEQTAELLDLGVTNPAEIASRTGVHTRTIQRYLRELQGNVDRRGIVYPEVKPLVLAHLRKYPHLRITSCSLARALKIPDTLRGRVNNSLRSLERDGLVRHEICTRKDGDYGSAVKVTLWSLAEQGQPDGQ